MEDEGRLTIIDNHKEKAKKGKEPLKYGTVVFCRGHNGTESFYGIVYEYGVIELPYGSNAYINTNQHLHIGDSISYWTIERVCKNAKLIIED